MADLANEGRRLLALRSAAGRGPATGSGTARPRPRHPRSGARPPAGPPSAAPPPRGLFVSRPLWGERPDKGSARPGRRVPRRPRAALRGQPRGGRPPCRGGRGRRPGAAPVGASRRLVAPGRRRGGSRGAAAAAGSLLPRSLCAESEPRRCWSVPWALCLSPGAALSCSESLLVQLLFGVIVPNFRTAVNLSLTSTRVNLSFS